MKPGTFLAGSILLSAVLLGSSCARVGPTRSAAEPAFRVWVPTLVNASTDANASRVLTEMVIAALHARRIEVVESSEPESTAEFSLTNALARARAAGATHVLTGTVNEYRYKTDLAGDPVVGISLRLIDTQSGLTVWRQSAAKVGILFSSLTRIAERTARELVGRIPRRGFAPGTALPETSS